MDLVIEKKELEKIMKIKGEVKGISFKSDAEFVLREKGEDGLKELEKVMSELGYPIKYEEIKPMEFYPVRLLALTTTVIEKIFNFDRAKFRQMGLFASKVPLAIRIFMKYFGSFDILTASAPRMWRTYYTIGSLEVIEHDERKKYALVRVSDYPLPLNQCYILEGYIAGVVKMVVKTIVTCQEIKCANKGDKYHEFLIKW